MVQADSYSRQEDIAPTHYIERFEEITRDMDSDKRKDLCGLMGEVLGVVEAGISRWPHPKYARAADDLKRYLDKQSSSSE